MLEGKKILLGITGSIAAYKSALLVRLLAKQGAEVKVIMTPLAKEFITPLTLATLSKNHVPVEFFNPENGEWNSHVGFGIWADAFIIAPATANTISKMANGIADNLLLTSYLSAKCPVFIAPAMDLDMYQHPATKRNIEILQSYGNHFIEPTSGELASGLSGKGRMEEPEMIVEKIKEYFQKKNSLLNKRILITAGPTFEKIDAVRFIGNHSSGKMGYALAEECAARGAKVSLVSGPVNIRTDNPSINILDVLSANEMFSKTKELFTDNDVAILAAAVADFTPESPTNGKLKRTGDSLQIILTPTKDIAAELGNIKNQNQITVGFALEKDNEINNAIQKLKKKNLNFIVLNSLNDKGAGFNSETNKITIIDNKENIFEFNLKYKNLVAIDIIDKLEEYLKNTNA
ncbi:MAG: bifunctional phosphopantothenoylcysteine decarboxylase/phosphopantothenate--cysteine ligase CoaBC [Bacteroidales bacterium]|nr:bifunctional phosphopantothenoylcysteine decarboxylase/phosphopantothenate--cysteine ligase CoaBC [Bacteroidales bacterium]